MKKFGISPRSSKAQPGRGRPGEPLPGEKSRTSSTLFEQLHETYAELKNSTLTCINQALESLLTEFDFNASLGRGVPGQGVFLPLLGECLKYSLLPGGKRIRPLFSLFLCRDLRGDFARLLTATLALEMVHTSSLLHDDLPALDNDDMRRGKAALHKKFGEGLAILTGDFLVPWSFYLISRSQFSNSQKVELASILSSSYMEVCRGQQLDISAGGQGRKDLLNLYALKTGSLFRAAAEFAAVASGLDNGARNEAAALGLELGIYFQILDDCKDVRSVGADKGRRGSSDERNQKRTFFPGEIHAEGRIQMTAAASRIEKQFCMLEESLPDKQKLEATRCLFEELS